MPLSLPRPRLPSALAWLFVPALAAAAPELIVTGAQIVTGDAFGTVQEAVAVERGRIIAVGRAKAIAPLAGPGTKVLDLKGRMVLPGLYEAHVHALRAAKGYLMDPYEELRSIAEIQDWVRKRARQVPPGEWIRIPRNEITRLSEFRHPTVAELDDACTTHPVVFNAVRKYVLNTRGFHELGIADDALTVPGGTLIPGADGRRQFLVTRSPQLTTRFAPHRQITEVEHQDALVKLHQAYHAAGITTIFERASRMGEYRFYERLRDAGRLSIRTRFTIRNAFRDGKALESFVKREGIQPGNDDEWLSIGTLKIGADGGIHWGNTRLSERYGPKRNAVYVRSDPEYRGDMLVTVEQMQSIFAAAARLGWQMIVHVTGDGGTDLVLRTMEAVNREIPLRGRRFMLTHSYFPTPALAARAAALGMGVDTQVYTYHMDAPFIHDIYGSSWAERLIGLGHWIRAGVPVVASSDHMVGYDANHSMNSYNPFIGMYVAVTRRAANGKVYGANHRLSRIEALRAYTANPAYLNFEEDRSGTLEPGKFADFVVIDRDYLTCPEDEILGIKVLRTVVGGKTVYERQP